MSTLYQISSIYVGSALSLLAMFALFHAIGRKKVLRKSFIFQVFEFIDTSR